MITYPNAKINIGLSITERRPDGYHNIESVFYPINLQDAVEIKTIEGEEPQGGYKLKVSGTILDGTPDDNLVVKAYQLLRKDFNFPAQKIHLYKHIPVGAGLGGGSSDAAAIIKMLNEKFALGLTSEQMQNYAVQIGADCPFFINNTPVFATGIGNIFTPIELSLHGKTILLVKPDIFVSTRDAYALVKPSPAAIPLTESIKQPISEWKQIITNDFEKSVFAKYPEIAAIKDKLYDMGALYASMSGSGSAVYGIFDSPIEYADEIFSGYFCRQREL
ncbi:MAG: 4-(cytidine 5'-diphospho)-2-C-methyl-D-erythritol kinase [Bacteroidaceae bacterium]|nr:4-(cytidine 5'-diphospho)-2-C-methyl-D-erythritol kinase [Bacteroidaceae bacterium]